MTQKQTKPTWWTIALAPVGLAAIMTPAILLAAGGSGDGFNAVVSGIEHRYHAHATRIPFMGLISLVAGRATHGGVRGLHVAEIENLQGPVDGMELNALVEERVGPGWQRIVRETSRSGDEQSLIYVRPEGDHLGMLVVDLDGHEANVVQLSMNPDQLVKQMEDHHHHKAQSDDSKPAESTPAPAKSEEDDSE